MAEYIEKQTAIDAINHELLCGSTADACGLETAYDLIHDLKPADVRPVVRGRWVVNQTAMGTNYSVCSECEKEFCFRTDYGTLIKIDLSGTNYCPNCGAEMRGE